MLCLHNEGPGDESKKPYENGAPCQQCDKTIYPTCPNNLCSTKLATTTSSTTCVSSSGVLAMMAAEKVGCATKECENAGGTPTSKTGKTIGMLCLHNEGPGDESKKPYENGAPCQQCDKTIYPTCPNNLCSTKLATTTSSTTCVSSLGVLAMMGLLIGNHFN
nr:hypothetical transcript [Hymenolepis microstoma]